MKDPVRNMCGQQGLAEVLLPSAAKWFCYAASKTDANAQAFRVCPAYSQEMMMRYRIENLSAKIAARFPAPYCCRLTSAKYDHMDLYDHVRICVRRA